MKNNFYKLSNKDNEINFIIGCHDEAKYIKELERLNNIINELDKYIEELREEYCKKLQKDHNCIDLFIENTEKLNTIINIKYKLQELKGGDK